MVSLDTKFFQGDGDLPLDIRDRVTISDFHESTATALRSAGWEGQLISTVGLGISADGQLVQNATFIMQGALHNAAIPLKASGIWEGASKDVTMHITLPDCSAFQFTGGELCSDFLPQALVKTAFTREGGQPVLPTEWEAYKLGSYSLRLIAHLDKSSNGRAGPHFRVSVLLFPLSVDELLELSEAVQSPAWPGIRILEGKSELFPRAPPGIWGCPLFPLINTSNRAEGCDVLPSGPRLRYAIAELLKSAVLPTACKGAGLRKQMEGMAADPEAYEARQPAVTWPTAPRPADNTGSQHTYRIAYCVVLSPAR